MSTRLTPEREAEIRRMADNAWFAMRDDQNAAFYDLLAEIDALRKERDEAMQNARRYVYIHNYLSHPGSPYMDGTSSWRVSPLYGRHRTFNDAIDEMIRIEKG